MRVVQFRNETAYPVLKRRRPGLARNSTASGRLPSMRTGVGVGVLAMDVLLVIHSGRGRIDVSTEAHHEVAATGTGVGIAPED